MNKIKEAFGEIHAEERLKEHTRQFLAENPAGLRRQHRILAFRLAPVAACLALLATAGGGYRLYLTPTSVISIDINPSLELGINRFDRVVSVDEYNDAGARLAETLDIRFKDYSEAIEEIIQNESVAAYLAQDEIMTITVVGAEGKQGERILADVETSTQGRENMRCHAAGFNELEEAHAMGLSYGKYAAFLALQRLEPEVTVQDIEGLSMHEIHNRIQELDSTHGEGHDAYEDEHMYVDDGTLDDGTVDDSAPNNGSVDDGTWHDGSMDDGAVHDGNMDDGSMHDGNMHDGNMDGGNMDDGRGNEATNVYNGPVDDGSGNGGAGMHNGWDDGAGNGYHGGSDHGGGNRHGE